jgi:hypothetical protein
MKTNFFKVSTVLTVTILFLTILIGNAFGFGLKNLTGGKKKEKVNVDALVDKQSNLCKRLSTALIDITSAQEHFALALNDKRTAEACKLRGKSLAEGNLTNPDTINKHIAATKETAEKQKELLKNADKWDAAKKRELQKGLVPYATGTVHSVLLGKEFADHLNSTKDAIKQAGMTGALSVKKKLGVTLSVGPNVPRLGGELLTTSNTVIQVAKKAKLNTSDAVEKLGELDS